MMFLVDTNIFLEVLLIQDKEEDCKEFLDKHIDYSYDRFFPTFNWRNYV